MEINGSEKDEDGHADDVKSSSNTDEDDSEMGRDNDNSDSVSDSNSGSDSNSDSESESESESDDSDSDSDHDGDNGTSGRSLRHRAAGTSYAEVEKGEPLLLHRYVLHVTQANSHFFSADTDSAGWKKGMRVKVPYKGGKSKYAAIILSVSDNRVRLRFVDDGEVDEYDSADIERIYDDDGAGDETSEEGETSDVNEEYDLGSEPNGDGSGSDSEFDTDDEDECILSKNKGKGIMKKLKEAVSGSTKKMKDMLPNIKKGSKKKSKPNGNGKDLCYSCASRSMCKCQSFNCLLLCSATPKGTRPEEAKCSQQSQD